VTQFGRIIGIENEGLAVLPPWQKLANFSIRAEQADIENANGSTSDTQPVKVSMTVRYSIMPDKVAEIYEKYSHSGDLSVEAEQKQKVAIAEAEASAVKARADGEAYASLKIATAQAEALKIQNAALSQNKDVLELRRIEVERTKAERWNGQLPQNVYAGAPIPFLQVTH
jgi:regulator of protease activity HflC (stomatin/prohibitin superfamily)